MQLLLPEKTETPLDLLYPEVSSLLKDERDDLIAFLHIFKKTPQDEIANQFNVSQQLVSKIVCKYLEEEEYTKRVVRKWEKEYLGLAGQKATELVKKVDADKHPKSKLVVDSATLVDKMRLIMGASTANIAYADLSDGELDARITALEAEMEANRL